MHRKTYRPIGLYLITVQLFYVLLIYNTYVYSSRT